MPVYDAYIGPLGKQKNDAQSRHQRMLSSAMISLLSVFESKSISKHASGDVERR